MKFRWAKKLCKTILEAAKPAYADKANYRFPETWTT